ncbi:MAG: hypothetical protein JRS35_22435 [Deltaproteobacteria bacterium]|nr:hypothetical protein [Deltaproteobacteria bacterium]
MRAVLVALAVALVSVLRSRASLHLEVLALRHQLVLHNARRHARKASRGLRCDPASSGRWFDGWRRRPEAHPAQARLRGPPVARARSWLLRLGWRRHGLIDPLEVPGRRR